MDEMFGKCLTFDLNKASNIFTYCKVKELNQ